MHSVDIRNGNRATIPINESYYLLLTLDVAQKDFNAIIMDKIIPLVEKEKSKFDSMPRSRAMKYLFGLHLRLASSS